MRSLIRTKLLAAVCALLLASFAVNASANIPDKPIENDPVPQPVPPQIGDPDDSQGIILIIPVFGRMISIHMSFVIHRAPLMSTGTIHLQSTRSTAPRAGRGGHAR